jgi:uncharacterized membrane protein YtjA (UPF0391 family)
MAPSRSGPLERAVAVEHRTAKLVMDPEGVCNMLKWALIFLVVGLILGALGFGGVGGAFVEIAKILFYICVVVFLVFLVLALLAGRAVT